MSPRGSTSGLALVAGLVLLTSCGATAAKKESSERMATSSLSAIVPKPVTVRPAGGTFVLRRDAQIVVKPGNAELRRIGEHLAARLNRATGFAIPVLPASRDPGRGIFLTTASARRALGAEGYELRITAHAIVLSAYRPAGLFRGIQTIRQLLPYAIERPSVQRGPWPIATGTIRDYPRFAWRGAMLDVARHFFDVADVKRFVDLMAHYKLNRLHLHLTDDQGWRIAIASWPRLATRGGSSEVGGGRGGYYTQADYSEIVDYAADRYIVTIPEIDMPGHTNAALASYRELACDGVAPSPYTGIEVGFSSLCIRKERTYEFVEDVVRELAAVTPGPYLHIGGDEAAATAPAEYRSFVERVQKLVRAHGKRMIGWEEIARTGLYRTSVAQHWKSDLVRRAVEQGAKVIMSPASKAYMDIKYDASTLLGQDWAGHTSVRDAYGWDPATQVAGVHEKDLLGIEAPLWTETIETMADVEFMAFPRLPGYAEIGWSRPDRRGWNEYRARLGAHGPRLRALGVRFYRSPEVPWR